MFSALRKKTINYPALLTSVQFEQNQTSYLYDQAVVIIQQYYKTIFKHKTSYKNNKQTTFWN